jgi:lysophospholipase L1-like esterase
VNTPFRIVSMGDSIIWGQGLLETEKFDYLVWQNLQAKIGNVSPPDRIAHSGAVICAKGDSEGPEPGEVPVPLYSIMEQCARYADSSEAVDIVFLDGGINDVGLATILNPLAVIPSLDSLIHGACYTSMLNLLQAVSTKFSKPTCRILVTGYYPIISPKSDPFGVATLLGLHGIAMPDFGRNDFDMVNPVVDRCEEFFQSSTEYLMGAIADAHDPRIQFVPSGFTDDNAVFAGANSLLWGLALDGTFSPLDPVAPVRHPICDTLYSDPAQGFKREFCYRASAGHPNINGAIQFCRQVMSLF